MFSIKYILQIANTLFMSNPVKKSGTHGASNFTQITASPCLPQLPFPTSPPKGPSENNFLIAHNSALAAYVPELLSTWEFTAEPAAAERWPSLYKHLPTCIVQ